MLGKDRSARRTVGQLGESSGTKADVTTGDLDNCQENLQLPASDATLGKQIAASPKVHVIDSGLAGWLLGLSAAKISSREPAVLTEFGHLVETFAGSEGQNLRPGR
jgi:hypothetical protein